MICRYFSSDNGYLNRLKYIFINIKGYNNLQRTTDKICYLTLIKNRFQRIFERKLLFLSNESHTKDAFPTT